jgi:TonB family protein
MSRSLIVPALIVMFALHGTAQNAQDVATGMTGNLTGTVADPSGAMIPQATIVAIRDEGNRLTTQSNDSGQWSLHVPAGRYLIQVSKNGFEPYRREGVELDSSADVHLDIPLAVAPVVHTVDVVAPRPRALAKGTPARTPSRVRVGGNMQPPKPLKTIQPQYPEAARELDVEGPVVLQAVIGTDGSVLAVQPSLGVSNPDLVAAAMSAVGQWRYTPALLNGVPVEVPTTITVNFRLQ